jgi:hypothetical protein
MALLSVPLAGDAGRRVLPLAAVGALAVGAVALSGDARHIALELPSHAAVTLQTAWRELGSSFGWLGAGTGYDTNSALRYGGVPEGRYVENWYAKVMLETGVLGLVAITVALAALLGRLALKLRLLAADERALAAPLVVLLFVTAVSLFKGPYIDLDPLNVYFWLFAGMLLGLSRASGDGDAEALL